MTLVVPMLMVVWVIVSPAPGTKVARMVVGWLTWTVAGFAVMVRVGEAGGGGGTGETQRTSGPRTVGPGVPGAFMPSIHH